MKNENISTEELLRFLFDELDETRQAAVRKAVAEDAKLAATVQGLMASVAVVRSEYAGPDSDAFNDCLRRRMPEVFGPDQPETTRLSFLAHSLTGISDGGVPLLACKQCRPTSYAQHCFSEAVAHGSSLFSSTKRCSLTTWRWIMRHPVSRVSAAILILAVAGVALWFHGGGSTPAFADFVEPILSAKTVKYKMTVEMAASSPDLKLLPAKMQKDLSKGVAMTEVMMIMTPNGSRARKETKDIVNGSKTVEITVWEGGQVKDLTLQPAKKQATFRNFTNIHKDKEPKQEDSQDVVAGFRSLMLDARDRPGVQRESLGENDIDGRHVVGFRLSGYGLMGGLPDSVMVLWGDPKTNLPVRVEMTMAASPTVKVTMSDFAFHVEMNDSLFSVERPAGYEFIQGPPYDASPMEEKDLIETFRDYSEWSGGPFPASLDSGALCQTASRLKWTSLYREKPQEPQERQQRALDAAMAKLQRGLWFVQRLPKEADMYYAGKGVELGAADMPIFWYRPNDSKTYRVIYADLSVREADTPPNAPAMQPDPEPEEKDLIATLRDYSELSGGPFPNSLDMVSVLPMATVKGTAPQRSAKEELEILEAEARLMRGLKFVVSLPPDADSHYAGKGVSFGAADKPIFWYRPKDTKTYRIIHADLSVRDADTAPDMPVVQPEQDLIELFRDYSELSGGPFPNWLNLASIQPMLAVKTLPPGEGYERPSAKYLQEVTKAILRLQPGLDFAASLPPDADVHYAGRGVSLGAADTPIFWYRPKDAKTYRVIYADLSVREADTPPSMVVVKPEQDLIDTLRYCSELGSGPFPDSLDKDAWSAMVLKEKFGLEAVEIPNAQQMLEFVEIAMLKLQPGSTFVASLPPEADQHYAGKGVSLGAADTPVFWYKPTGSEKYRVIFADLSVKDMTSDDVAKLSEAKAQ